MAEQKIILVVDDDRELVEGLRAVLERQGYRVIQAHDGHQGKQAIYNQQPDLVILDMMMPRMGGYPVLEHFRGKTDAPPIIMITANEGSRHKAYAEYLGVIDYIRKPFAMERLLETVNKALSALMPRKTVDPRPAEPGKPILSAQPAPTMRLSHRDGLLSELGVTGDSGPLGGRRPGARRDQRTTDAAINAVMIGGAS